MQLGEKWYWLTAARTLGHPVKGVVGVTGYHFYPQHLRDVLNSYTNIPVSFLYLFLFQTVICAFISDILPQLDDRKLARFSL